MAIGAPGREDDGLAVVLAGAAAGVRRGPQAAGHRGCRARQSPRRRARVRRTRRNCRPATAGPRVNPGRLRRVALAALPPRLLASALALHGLGGQAWRAEGAPLIDCEETPHHHASNPDKTGEELRLFGPVESCPNGTTGIVAVDSPFVGDDADDVESVMTCGAAGGRGPWSAVVLDFDPDVVTWTDGSSDCEGTAGQAGVAVKDGVGGEFGCAEDHVVCHRA